MRQAVERVRRFNRSWTEVLGLLDHGLLHTEFCLSEARVIFELAQRDSWERLVLRRRLDMDASFLTRVLTRLEDRGLVRSWPSAADGRAIELALTDAGRKAFQVLDERSAEQISVLLTPLGSEQRTTLTECMTVVTRLTGRPTLEPVVSFRDLMPGDLGWMIQRHGAIYADEFGWNSDFEALVAEIVARYHRELKPGRERAWIAEVDGARAGCVLCCQKDKQTAQLRILLVEPWARGLHLGIDLVERCIAFAREAEYRKIALWTNDVLVAARRIYQAAGFTLIDEEDHHSFGHDLVGQSWELELR